MMVQTYSKIPLYRASARVQIQDERTTAVSNLNANDPVFWQDSEQYYNTQYSILRSRGLARRVVQRLKLQNHPLFNGTAPQSRGPLSADARGAAGARRRRCAACSRVASVETPMAKPGRRRERGRGRAHRPVPRRRRDRPREGDAPGRGRLHVVRARSSPRWRPRRWPRNTRSRTSTCGSRRSTRTWCG